MEPIVIAMIAGIAVSLFFGVKSLKQTNEIRQKEYRRERLKEILDWSVGILEGGKYTEVKSIIFIEAGKKREYARLVNIERVQYFLAVKGRGIYIKEIAVKFWPSLQAAVNKLLKDIESQIAFRNVLGEALGDRNRPGLLRLFGTETEKVKTQLKDISQSAIDLIKKAVEVSIEDTG